MRKLIIAQYASLDGVVEAPEQWHFPYADENMFRTLKQVNSECDTMLLVSHRCTARRAPSARRPEPQHTGVART